MLAISQQ